MKKTNKEKKILQGLWWVREGEWGGMTQCSSMEQALAHCRQSHKNGYGQKEKRDPTQICVVVKTTEYFVYNPETDSLEPDDVRTD